MLKGKQKVIFPVLLVLVGVGLFGLGDMFGSGRLALHRRGSVAGNLPSSLNYATVNQVYRSLKDNYDGKLTASQLEYGLKHGLANATGDPYTSYFTPAEAKGFESQLNNSFSGIGAELGKNSAGSIQVIAPIAGMPAEKAGLKPQDVIATINGKTTADMSVEDAVSAIRGKAGTAVKLQIIRSGQEQDFTITRQNIQVPSVSYKVLDGTNLGYIQIITFAEDTPQLIQKAADALKAAQVKGVILDLRSNPGGLVDSAVAVSSEWLPDGQTIMQEKRGSEIVQSYNATGGNTLSGIKTVVLVDGGSASASEITAGALHDHNDATVIGTKTYGKGVVQQLINFGDGSELKVTVASWYRPNGQNINHKGITPDKIVKANPGDSLGGNDAQLDAAKAALGQ